MKNKNLDMGLNGAVMLIGLYMIYLGWGSASAPLLSGVAFVLIGIKHCSLMK